MIKSSDNALVHLNTYTEQSPSGGGGEGEYRCSVIIMIKSSDNALVHLYTYTEQSPSGGCTDGNTAFRCDSDKNSLVIIYMF